MFLARAKHNAKVLVGGQLERILFKQYLAGQGPGGRLISVFSDTASRLGVEPSIVVDQPIPVPKAAPPQFSSHREIDAHYRNALLSWDPVATNKAGLFLAPNVVVSFPTGMHRIGDHILKEVISTPFMPTYPLLANPKYYFGLELMPFKRKRVGAEGILLSMPKHHNFFHWLIEFLPRLALYDRCPHLKDVPLIMPKSSPKFIVESLKLTGYLHRTIFLDDGTYKFEKLYLLSMLSANDAISWLNEKFQTGQCPPVKPKRIYISRADAKIRFVSNELQLQDTLLKFGFTTLEMSKLSLGEQISVFRTAECIIGPHGAAFTNLAFAQPGSTFIEFFSKGNIHTSYNRISGIRQLKYGFIVGEPTAMGGFSIDPAELRTILSQALC